jgi:hypothetical protein
MALAQAPREIDAGGANEDRMEFMRPVLVAEGARQMKRMFTLLFISISLSVAATLLATWVSPMVRQARHELRATPVA